MANFYHKVYFKRASFLICVKHKQLLLLEITACNRSCWSTTVFAISVLIGIGLCDCFRPKDKTRIANLSRASLIARHWNSICIVRGCRPIRRQMDTMLARMGGAGSSGAGRWSGGAVYESGAFVSCLRLCLRFYRWPMAINLHQR